MIARSLTLAAVLAAWPVASTTGSNDAAGHGDARVIGDTSPPVAESPDAGFWADETVGPSAIPLRVAWSAGFDEAGISHYELEHRLEAGPWLPVGPDVQPQGTLATVPSATVSEYRVRAIDQAGDAGPWAAGGPVWVRSQSERSANATFDEAWVERSSRRYLGGSAFHSDRPGAAFRYISTGTDLAIVATRRPTGGVLHVSIDGVLETIVPMWSEMARHRTVLYSISWPTAESRVIDAVLQPSNTGSRADIDGFLVAGPPAIATLVGAGDIASCAYTTDSATADLVASTPGQVFTAGDNVYPSGSARQFADCYEPTWGRFRARTRPAPGNHDYVAPEAAPYFAYFGRNVGPAERGWYAFRAGTWRVYSLNSNCSLVGGCGAGSRQHRWLVADLAAHPRRCVLAIWHHPRFSSGYHGSSSATRGFVRALHRAGAEIVINGHDHDYERFAAARPGGAVDPLTGIRQFVVGTGGAPLHRMVSAPLPHSEVRDDETHGVLRLDLGWGSYDWVFLPAGGGTFTDAGTGECH